MMQKPSAFSPREISALCYASGMATGVLSGGFGGLPIGQAIVAVFGVGLMHYLLAMEWRKL